MHQDDLWENGQTVMHITFFNFLSSGISASQVETTRQINRHTYMQPGTAKVNLQERIGVEKCVK